MKARDIIIAIAAGAAVYFVYEKYKNHSKPKTKATVPKPQDTFLKFSGDKLLRLEHLSAKNPIYVPAYNEWPNMYGQTGQEVFNYGR